MMLPLILKLSIGNYLPITTAITPSISLASWIWWEVEIYFRLFFYFFIRVLMKKEGGGSSPSPKLSPIDYDWILFLITVHWDLLMKCTFHFYPGPGDMGRQRNITWNSAHHGLWKAPRQDCGKSYNFHSFYSDKVISKLKHHYLLNQTALGQC